MFTIDFKHTKKYLVLLSAGIIISCTGASYSSNHVQAKEKSSFMTTSSKAATSGQKKYRAYDKVSLFSNSSKKSKVLATIPRKTVITPINKINGWFKIKNNNKTGWVSEEYFLEYFELKKYQTTEAVELRSDPSSSSKKIMTIPKSKIIMSAIEDNGWYQVMYNGKKRGWISGKHLRFREEMKYFETTKALNLFSTRSTKSKKLDTLPKSVVVSSDQKHDGWYKINYDKKTGWILAKNTKPHTFSKPDAMDYGPLVKDIYAKAKPDLFVIKESGSFYVSRKGLAHVYSKEDNRFLIMGSSLESFTLAAQALSKMTGNPDVNGLRLALMSCRMIETVSYKELDFASDGNSIAVYF
ncbi:SH3 domain-containing protein [Exiguobacterium sp. s193]|uniref:SH3 domain-containing protein n=1 Tax=Exiguobacterium sp. s193 TaxID=2751207 RepID=UPI001BE5A514